MLALIFVLSTRAADDDGSVYQLFDANAAAHGRPAVTVSPECIVAVQAARQWGVHIHDRDGDGVITIDDVGPAAVQFGMLYLDYAPRDGQMSLSELKAKWSLSAPWWLKTASWTTSFFTSKFTPERVFEDCASTRTPTVITMTDYMARRHSTCMETCSKAEDVFNFIGGNIVSASIVVKE
jgi:hypothetical protein